MRNKSIIAIIPGIIVGGFILFWASAIIKCEILTSKYGKEFIGFEVQTNMLNPGHKLKVLDYSEDIATIYYYNKYGGDVLEFRKDNNVWILNKWVETVWSSSGSADGFIWPYIR